MRNLIPILCVTLGLGLASGQSDAQTEERAHAVGSCDVIQRSDSPCVLVNVVPETRESKSVRNHLTLEKGLVVPVRATKAMHSRNVQSHTFGQRIDLEVTSDVVIDGLVVIAAGTEAWGSLASSKQPGRFLAPGHLEIVVEGTRTVTGDIVPLSGSLEVAGGNSCSDDGSGGCAVGAVLVGAVIKGTDAEVRRGTYISAHIAETLLFDRTAIESSVVVPRVSDELRHAIEAGKGLVIAYRLPDDGCRGYETTNGGPLRPTWCGTAHLAIDQNPATALAAGHFLQFEVDPGQHLLHGPNSEELWATVSCGSVQYIRIKVSGWRRHPQLAIVATEIGQTESYPLEETELKTSAAIH